MQGRQRKLHGVEYQQLKKHGTCPRARCSTHGMQSKQLWLVLVQSQGPQMPQVSRHGAAMPQPGVDIMIGKHGMNWHRLRQSIHDQSIISCMSDEPLGSVAIDAASMPWSQHEGSQS